MIRRLLIVVLAVLGAISVASGLAGVLFGPASVPGGAPAPASVDSEYRFTNVFWLAAGIALWWTLFRPGERRAVTRSVLVVAFFGGLARIVSIFATGWPDPIFIGTIALELLALPLVIWWHAQIIDAPDLKKSVEA